MCGRIVWVWDAATGELVAHYDDRGVANQDLMHLLETHRFNVPPASTLPFVIAVDEQTRLEAARWGLPLPQRATGVFNTRAEALQDSPMWKDLFGRRHAMIPVKGFYEWRRSGATRTPYFVYRADGAPMQLAALWGKRTVDGELRTCASIVTCPANELVSSVHDRMPVVLETEEAEAWLEPQNHDPGDLLALADPADDNVLSLHEVSTAVNSTDNDAPELIEPTGQQRLF